MGAPDKVKLTHMQKRSKLLICAVWSLKEIIVRTTDEETLKDIME